MSLTFATEIFPNDDGTLKLGDSDKKWKINGGGTSTQYLKGDGTWDTPVGTYSLPTASSSTKGGIKVNGNGLKVESDILKHSNSVTAKTSFVDTATTAHANGGKIKVTDIKYDAYGHITGSQDREITLSQTTYTIAGLMGSTAKGSTTLPIYWSGTAFGTITSYEGNAATANGLVDGSSTMTSAYNKAGLNYADYSWLAGWNGYELRAVAKTQFAQASHNHYQLITEGDNRSVATTPNSYNNNLVFRGLKTNSAFGSPSSDTYSYVVGLRGWSDSSGGNAYELAFNNTGIYCRNGATTSWGSWNKILTLSDGNSAYVKKSGDTMTGNLIVSKTGDTYVEAKNTDTGCRIEIDVNAAGKHGLWSSGYYANSTYTASSKWIYYRGTDGEAHSDVKIYGAVWNDYAEFRKDNTKERDIQIPGRCVHEIGDGTLALTTKRLERGCEIISDTFGFAIGQDEENGYNTPIASNGRVLAYPYESIEEFASHIGYPVCSGPNGTVSIMTDEEEEKYPSRIIGTISEIPSYEEWGTGKVKVNGRIWIRIK